MKLIWNPARGTEDWTYHAYEYPILTPFYWLDIVVVFTMHIDYLVQNLEHVISTHFANYQLDLERIEDRPVGNIIRR